MGYWCKHNEKKTKRKTDQRPKVPKSPLHLSGMCLKDQWVDFRDPKPHESLLVTDVHRLSPFALDPHQGPQKGSQSPPILSRTHPGEQWVDFHYWRATWNPLAIDEYWYGPPRTSTKATERDTWSHKSSLERIYDGGRSIFMIQKSHQSHMVIYMNWLGHLPWTTTRAPIRTMETHKSCLECTSEINGFHG